MDLPRDSGMLVEDLGTEPELYYTVIKIIIKTVIITIRAITILGVVVICPAYILSYLIFKTIFWYRYY